VVFGGAAQWVAGLGLAQQSPDFSIDLSIGGRSRKAGDPSVQKPNYPMMGKSSLSNSLWRISPSVLKASAGPPVQHASAGLTMTI
jgi:hypothetical protein